MSDGAGRYALRPVVGEDRALFLRWRAMPHVRAWWGEPDADGPADPRVSRWIAMSGGAPFAYVQDYAVHDWPGHHFAHLPPGARGIDLYIGESAMLGRGHGSALVRQHADALLDAGAPVVAVDPDPANARSIAAFRRAGFGIDGTPIDTAWGPALPMAIRRNR